MRNKTVFLSLSILILASACDGKLDGTSKQDKNSVAREEEKSDDGFNAAISTDGGTPIVGVMQQFPLDQNWYLWQAPNNLIYVTPVNLPPDMQRPLLSTNDSTTGMKPISNVQATSYNGVLYGFFVMHGHLYFFTVSPGGTVGYAKPVSNALLMPTVTGYTVEVTVDNFLQITAALDDGTQQKYIWKK